MHFKVFRLLLKDTISCSLDRKEKIVYGTHPFCIHLNTKIEDIFSKELTTFVQNLEQFLQTTFSTENYIAYVPWYTGIKNNEYIQIHVHFKNSSDAVLFKLTKGGV